MLVVTLLRLLVSAMEDIVAKVLDAPASVVVSLVVHIIVEVAAAARFAASSGGLCLTGLLVVLMAISLLLLKDCHGSEINKEEGAEDC